MLTNIQDIQGNLTFIEIAKVTLYLEELSLKICIYVHVSLLFSETVEVVLTRWVLEENLGRSPLNKNR